MLESCVATVESQIFDWAAIDVSCTQLSSGQDARWAGIHNLAPFDKLDLQANARHDLYVLRGSVLERGKRRTAGTFFSRNQPLSLTADADGSLLFCYRDTLARTSGHETWASDELDWWEGSVPGMQVAPLSKLHHRVSLVKWQRGTRADWHTHPHGEEIFVLSGELRDERGTYPAGSWMRFHPGSGHAPYAEQDTLTLLRNGHLPA
jgi:quercetin dioxygenase-like cupin family protein